MEENTKNENQEGLNKDQDTSGNVDEKNKEIEIVLNLKKKNEALKEKYEKLEKNYTKDKNDYFNKVSNYFKHLNNEKITSIEFEQDPFIYEFSGVAYLDCEIDELEFNGKFTGSIKLVKKMH